MKGHSEHTPEKQRCLNVIVGKLAGIISRQRWMKPFIVDCTAGDGEADHGARSSPEILWDHACFINAPFYMIESDGGRASILDGKHIGDGVINDTWQSALPPLAKKLMGQHHNAGLVYFDHNGLFPDGGLKALWEFTTSCSYVDILISVCACGLKRAGDSTGRLRSNVARKHYWVQEPRGQFQWTFILGTNCPPNSLGDLRSANMHPTTSSKGKEICDRIDHTRGQQLLQLQRIPCDIGVSEVCA